MTSDEVLAGSDDHYSWMLSTSVLMILPPNSFQGSDRQQVWWTDVSRGEIRRRIVRRIPAEGLDPCGYGIDVFLFASRHLIVVRTQTCIFRCCILFEAVVCRLYEMLYPISVML